MAVWAAPPLPARLTGGDASPFVGRRRELERLEEAWGAVERRERQAVFVGGEPGSGKTRVVMEVAGALHAQDVVVLLGSSSPDLAYPYGPMVEALNHLLGATKEGDLAHLLDDSAGELLRITSQVRRHRPDLPDPPPDRQEYRRELFDAYTQLMVAAARERPLALILEDLHWSSPPTRLLLSHLIRSTVDVPLLVLATMRTSAPDRSDELAFMVADLYRLPGVSRIDLGGLEVADIEKYLRDAGADREHLRETAAVLRDQTGGNPFFVRELWLQMVRSGGLRALKAGNFVPPPTIRDALAQRVGSFGTTERTTLELAAVAGDTFDMADVASASGESRERVLQALDRAAQYGLIRAQDRGGSFAFQHFLTRQALLASLTPSRSAKLHAAVAEAVERRFETDPGVATLLSRLYQGAVALGYEEKAVFYLRQSALRAERGLAHEEAAELWERAARLVTSDRELRDRLLLSSAQCHLRSGGFPEARRIYKEVHGSPDARTSLQAAIGYENASWRPGHHGHEARDLLTSALANIPPDPTDPLYVGAVTALGRAHTFSGERERADETIARALAMARQLADERLIGGALVAGLIQVMTEPGINQRELTRAGELREIALRTGEYDLLGTAGTYRAMASYMGGRIDGWYAGWDDLRLVSTRTAQPFWEWLMGCYEYCHLFMRGDFAKAEVSTERNRELGYGFGTDDTEGSYGTQMYLLRRETGQLDGIRDLMDDIPVGDGSWSPGLLALYTELGYDQAARRLLREILEGIRGAHMRAAVWPATLVFLAEAASHLEDVGAAEMIRPWLSEYEGLNLMAGHSIAVFGSADRYLGMIDLTLGDLEQAEMHFERSLTMDRLTRSVVHEGETLARFAMMLNRRDGPADRPRAAALREEARALATPIGDRRVLRLLDGARVVTDRPDGLTPREVEVLRLLARGASNKEIGDRLFISQNTAANHVRNILIKTGSSNRTQAAIYAADSGLL
jgi:DNA-binding CsgD family transcriptional regulator